MKPTKKRKEKPGNPPHLNWDKGLDHLTQVAIEHKRKQGNPLPITDKERLDWMADTGLGVVKRGWRMWVVSTLPINHGRHTIREAIDAAMLIEPSR